MDKPAVHAHAIEAPEQERLAELIEALSAYIEQYHGGWVRFISYDGEVLRVAMGGACETCRLSRTTLHGWIGGTVRQFFPHIARIETI